MEFRCLVVRVFTCWKIQFCNFTHYLWLEISSFANVFISLHLFLAEPRKYIPAVVVGVVGMGHVPGIEKNWNSDLNIQEIMR